MMPPALAEPPPGDSTAGLSAAEAAVRLRRFGPNVAAGRGRRSLLAMLLRKIADPLVAILLIAAAISGATGDWQSLVIIVLIVLFSIGLDVVQEHKAERAIEALKQSVAVTAQVWRDGALVRVPVREIVPGDVVELRAGDLVPADGTILRQKDALADEALLTGEPYGVEKRAASPGAGDPGHDASTYSLYAGTSLVGGAATLRVDATGRATRFGAIAAALDQRAGPTAFERGVHRLGMLILRLTGFLVLFVLLTQLARTGLTLDSFLFAVALAVGLTPELLPMVMTVTLARGALRMAQRQVVVKRLSAIHDFGAMDVLCTDKTGTLTEARIALVETFDASGAASPHVAELARRNARFASGMRSNLDEALLVGAADQETWRLLADLPFDFQRRRSSVLLARDGLCQMVVKGAPEEVLARCDRVEDAAGDAVPLGDEARARIAALLAAKGQEGLRLLGVAWRVMPTDCAALTLEDEVGLVFAGCAAFLDPPKASAGAAVERLRRAGIAVKVISGDAEPVVRHLMTSLGLPVRRALTGAQIAELSDIALAAQAPQTDLFVRVSPDQKMRVVQALRRRGHTVGFMGDGINDAPAIHAADVGLSVEGGTDVAREAADIILLAPDLGVLADGVAEGRRTYANIMKYVRMGTSSNFGNMLSMAFASLVLPFLPLAPLQILVNNLLYDLSEIGIPFDRADPADLERPRSWDMRDVLHFTLVMGPLSSLFDLATFAVLRLGFGASEEMFRTAWFVESIATQILVIFIVRTAGWPSTSRPHPLLVASSLGALALALLIALTPLGHALGFGVVPWPVLGAIGLICLAYLASAEVLKRFAMRPDRPHSGRRR
ncbi:magnesium-translocating P-type ATPase [Aquabacter sediminis]|uniref:magnesium-translocating P-type ATPase n=1 Tax=Aquabacter sediminis TaxID=3029197 RepID=UPI003CCFE52B